MVGQRGVLDAGRGVGRQSLLQLLLRCAQLFAGRRQPAAIQRHSAGAGTSTHMNINEVIANLANRLATPGSDLCPLIHPNDHVNRSQSTNDTYPTAFRLALILRLESYMTALRQLQEAFFAKGRVRGDALLTLAYDSARDTRAARRRSAGERPLDSCAAARPTLPRRCCCARR